MILRPIGAAERRSSRSPKCTATAAAPVVAPSAAPAPEPGSFFISPWSPMAPARAWSRPAGCPARPQRQPAPCRTRRRCPSHDSRPTALPSSITAATCARELLMRLSCRRLQVHPQALPQSWPRRPRGMRGLRATGLRPAAAASRWLAASQGQTAQAVAPAVLAACLRPGSTSQHSANRLPSIPGHHTTRARLTAPSRAHAASPATAGPAATRACAPHAATAKGSSMLSILQQACKPPSRN